MQFCFAVRRGKKLVGHDVYNTEIECLFFESDDDLSSIV